MTALHGPGRWRLRLRQLLAVTRLELRRCFRGRRLVGLTVLNLAPVAILLLAYLIKDEEFARESTPSGVSQIYAVLFATWIAVRGARAR